MIHVQQDEAPLPDNTTAVNLDEFAIEDTPAESGLERIKVKVEDSGTAPTGSQSPVATIPTRLKHEVDRLASLIPTTVLLGALCCVIVLALGIPVEGSEPFLSLLPFGSSDTQNVGALVLESNANALAVMAIVVFLTYLFVGMFTFRFRRIMNVTVIVSFILCWGGFTGYFLWRVFPGMDWLTLVVLSMNMTVAGSYSVFAVEEDEWIVGDIFLIYLGAILSWPFACFPELTVFFFLFWMAIWDVIAVMTPCGPLRYALYIQQKRIWMAESEFVLPRGMVIKLRLYELGLGDLIFFGVVIARATSVGFETAVACFVSMLASVIFTVAATVASGRTIPALPIAMVIGILVYLMSRFTLLDYVPQVNFAQMVYM